MIQYINKSTIAAEIERLQGFFVNERDGFEKGYHHGLDMVLSFIDSVETKEIDIENVAITEWNDYIKKIDGDPDYAYMLIKRDDYIALAKHFYELGIKS